jgi:hypothetical protein
MVVDNGIAMVIGNRVEMVVDNGIAMVIDNRV